MIGKRIVAVFLLFGILFSFSSCYSEDPSLISPILYEVSDDEGGKIWLFGSIHVGTEDLYPLPRYVLKAFKKAKTLAVEFDLLKYKEDSERQNAVLEKFRYEDNETAEKKIPKNLYTDAKKILTENGLLKENLETLAPNVWADMIDEARYSKIGVKEEYGIDRYFLENAGKKKIVEVESPESQADMFVSLSDEIKFSKLYSVIQSFNEPIEESTLLLMLEEWKNGDETALADRFKKETEFSSEKAEEYYNEYYSVLSEKRNKAMAEYAEKALLSGEKTFICVGAAHIIGEGGVVEILSQKGYTVKTIRIPKADTENTSSIN